MKASPLLRLPAVPTRNRLLLLLLIVFVFDCGRVASPTAPRVTDCPNPAELGISVTPLRDPEGFIFMIDRNYDLADVVKRMKSRYELRNVELMTLSPIFFADVHPADLAAMRCEAGVLRIEQGRSNSGGG